MKLNIHLVKPDPMNTLRKDETAIRIISARKATKNEQKAYAGEKL
jgi:uncharacterized DUF497 family protein